MLHLLLLRHAKSSWVNPELSDFDRPLNKRGKRAARAMGDWLRREGWAPDLVLCSSSRRTRETWEAMALDGTPELRQDLYEAGAGRLLEVLRATPAGPGRILLIGHNPGISMLASDLVAAPPDHPRFDDFPTAALLIVGFEAGSPAGIEPGTGRVERFVTPHDLNGEEAD